MIIILTEQKKKYIAFTIFIYTGITIGSIDIYLPALPYLSNYFQSTPQMLQFSILIHPFIGGLLGILLGRLCDLYGRKPIMLGTSLIFTFGTILVGFAQNIEQFMIFRVIQAIGCSGGTIIPAIIVSDLFKGTQQAKYMAINGIIFPFVWVIAPILGAYLLTSWGWRSLFFVISFILPFYNIYFLYFFPETHKPNLSTNAAEKTFLDSFWELLKNKWFFGLSLGHSIPVSIFVLFNINLSFIFINGFKYTPTVFSYVQAIPIVLAFFSTVIYRAFINKLGLDNALRIGVMGYWIYILASVSCLLGLIPNQPEIVLTLFCLMSMAMAFLIPSSMTRSLEFVGNDNRGLAVSIVGLSRNLISALGAFFASYFINNTVYPVLIFSMTFCMVILIIMTLYLRRSPIAS